VNEQLRAVDVELEIAIDASKADVWDALVNDISQWWPKQAFMTKATKFTLEPRVGGRAFEDYGDGTGGIWWYVQAIEAGEYLVLTGQIWPGNGGPATSIARLSLVERGRETVLQIHDALFGRLSDERIESVRRGWEHLFGGAFRAFAEAKR
jgi:uncharacterized protein YndB with AHSA1/START domain